MRFIVLLAAMITLLAASAHAQSTCPGMETKPSVETLDKYEARCNSLEGHEAASCKADIDMFRALWDAFAAAKAAQASSRLTGKYSSRGQDAAEKVCTVLHNWELQLWEKWPATFPETGRKIGFK